MASDHLQIESGVQKAKRSLKVQAKSLAEFWRRYRKNRAAVLGLSMVVAFGSMAILAPILSPYNPFEMHLQDFTYLSLA